MNVRIAWLADQVVEEREADSSREGVATRAIPPMRRRGAVPRRKLSAEEEEVPEEAGAGKVGSKITMIAVDHLMKIKKVIGDLRSILGIMIILVCALEEGVREPKEAGMDSANTDMKQLM